MYADMKQQRLQVKHSKNPDDKKLSDALKLVLNSTYGLLGNKYSTLYNPREQLTVCIIGQCILYELAKRLSSYGTIVQANTDGIAFVPSMDGWKDIIREWEKEFNYTLEEDDYSLWIQRDVNNYIAVGEDGYITTKGGDVARYNKDKFFANNSTRILDIAIVNKLVYNKDILQSLLENLDDPKLFQYILQAGSTYKGTFDSGDNQYNKINRVFACKGQGVKLMKKRQDDGLVHFADSPDRMWVFNEDLGKLDPAEFRDKLDLNWYYKLISKKLEAWPKP